MYDHISRHRPTVDIYREKLITEQSVDAAKLDEIDSSILDEFEAAFVNAPNHQDSKSDWLESRWAGFKKFTQEGHQERTGVEEDRLKHVGLATTLVPDNFTLHKALARILKARAKTVETGSAIDFATAEAMAFGTLMMEGYHVRMSGQDVGRGTFSHRHAVLHDQKNEETYTPLQHLSSDQAQFTIENSHLSEYAVLGFELGYSMNSPQQLVLWEAQFGDFANTAQCIIDQFVSSGEQKWQRQCGLVMLLPHGYEGMGPEHSSARLERFLQMSDDDPYVFPEIKPGSGKQIQATNWQASRPKSPPLWLAPLNRRESAVILQVVNCSTAANYFHVLRRQVARNFRKPLICMTGKSTLRLRDACSDMSELTADTRFMRVLGEGHGPSAEETLEEDEKIRRLVMCSGPAAQRITSRND